MSWQPKTSIHHSLLVYVLCHLLTINLLHYCWALQLIRDVVYLLFHKKVNLNFYYPTPLFKRILFFLESNLQVCLIFIILTMVLAVAVAIVTEIYNWFFMQLYPNYINAVDRLNFWEKKIYEYYNVIMPVDLVPSSQLLGMRLMRYTHIDKMLLGYGCIYTPNPNSTLPCSHKWNPVCSIASISSCVLEQRKFNGNPCT